MAVCRVFSLLMFGLVGFFVGDRRVVGVRQFAGHRVPGTSDIPWIRDNSKQRMATWFDKLSVNSRRKKTFSPS